MSHQHQHCAHTMAYCGHCDVAYCSTCTREWGRPCNGYHYWPYSGMVTTTPLGAVSPLKTTWGSTLDHTLGQSHVATVTSAFESVWDNESDAVFDRHNHAEVPA